MLSVVKMLLKGEVGGCALNINGNYIVDRGKSWKHHGSIVFLNLCWNPVFITYPMFLTNLNVLMTWDICPKGVSVLLNFLVNKGGTS